MTDAGDLSMEYVHDEDKENTTLREDNVLFQATPRARRITDAKERTRRGRVASAPAHDVDLLLAASLAEVAEVARLREALAGRDAELAFLKSELEAANVARSMAGVELRTARRKVTAEQRRADAAVREALVLRAALERERRAAWGVASPARVVALEATPHLCAACGEGTETATPGPASTGVEQEDTIIEGARADVMGGVSDKADAGMSAGSLPITHGANATDSNTTAATGTPSGRSSESNSAPDTNFAPVGNTPADKIAREATFSGESDASRALPAPTASPVDRFARAPDSSPAPRTPCAREAEVVARHFQPRTPLRASLFSQSRGVGEENEDTVVNDEEDAAEWCADGAEGVADASGVIDVMPDGKAVRLSRSPSGGPHTPHRSPLATSADNTPARYHVSFHVEHDNSEELASVAPDHEPAVAPGTFLDSFSARLGKETSPMRELDTSTGSASEEQLMAMGSDLQRAGVVLSALFRDFRSTLHSAGLGAVSPTLDTSRRSSDPERSTSPLSPSTPSSLHNLSHASARPLQTPPSLAPPSEDILSSSSSHEHSGFVDDVGQSYPVNDAFWERVAREAKRLHADLNACRGDGTQEGDQVNLAASVARLLREHPSAVAAEATPPMMRGDAEDAELNVQAVYGNTHLRRLSRSSPSPPADGRVRPAPVRERSRDFDGRADSPVGEVSTIWDVMRLARRAVAEVHRAVKERRAVERELQALTCFLGDGSFPASLPTASTPTPATLAPAPIFTTTPLRPTRLPQPNARAQHITDVAATETSAPWAHSSSIAKNAADQSHSHVTGPVAPHSDDALVAPALPETEPPWESPVLGTAIPHLTSLTDTAALPDGDDRSNVESPASHALHVIHEESPAATPSPSRPGSRIPRPSPVALASRPGGARSHLAVPGYNTQQHTGAKGRLSFEHAVVKPDGGSQVRIRGESTSKRTSIGLAGSNRLAARRTSGVAGTPSSPARGDAAPPLSSRVAQLRRLAPLSPRSARPGSRVGRNPSAPPLSPSIAAALARPPVALVARALASGATYAPGVSALHDASQLSAVDVDESAADVDLESVDGSINSSFLSVGDGDEARMMLSERRSMIGRRSSAMGVVRGDDAPVPATANTEMEAWREGSVGEAQPEEGVFVASEAAGGRVRQMVQWHNDRGKQ